MRCSCIKWKWGCLVLALQQGQACYTLSCTSPFRAGSQQGDFCVEVELFAAKGPLFRLGARPR